MSNTGPLAFDVNETLLSLQPLARRLEAKYDGEMQLGEWFARVLHGSLLANILDQYRPFDEIAAEVLVRLARRAGREVTMGQARSIVRLMAEAPAHDDVLVALDRLASSGRRMLALTNGSTEMAILQMDNSGVRPFLERVISCDEVGRFKPDASVYRHAAASLEVEVAEITLVASHDWDCAGAMAAGAQAVFLARPGVTWNLPSPPPSLVVSDLGELADRIGG